MKQEHKKINQAVMVLFCVGLAGFSVVNALLPQHEFSDNENRILQEFPSEQLNWKNIRSGEFAQKFESFTSDQFTGRAAFVSAKAVMEKLSGKWENNGVYFAADDYLIQKPEDNPQELAKQAKNVESGLSAIRALAEAGPYDVTFLLVPTAYEVERDKLPPYAYRPVQTELEETAEKALEGSGVKLIWPKQTLEDGQEQVYYRTDHHWTGYGAFLGYQCLGEALGYSPLKAEEFDRETVKTDFYGTTWSKATLPDFPADTIELWKPKQENGATITFLGGEQATGEMDGLYAYGALEKKDAYTVFLDGNHSLLRIDTNLKNGKKLLVVKDSYAHCLIPFLANHYESIWVADLRYVNTGVTELMQENGIESVLVLYNCENFASDANVKKLSFGLE